MKRTLRDWVAVDGNGVRIRLAHRMWADEAGVDHQETPPWRYTWSDPERERFLRLADSAIDWVNWLELE